MDEEKNGTAPTAEDIDTSDAKVNNTDAPKDDKVASADKEKAAEEEHIKLSAKLKSNRLLLASVIAIIAISCYIIVNVEKFTEFLAYVGEIISPIIIGVIIAYLCNPVLKFYEYRLFRKMKNTGARRGLSLLMTFLTAIAVVVAIGFMIIPELIDSIQRLLSNFDSYLDSALNFVTNFVNSIVSGLSESDGAVAGEVEAFLNVEEIKGYIESLFSDSENILQGILTKLVNTEGFTSGVGNTLMYLVTTLKNVVLGIFIAIYILLSREKRIAQLKKFRRAFFSEKTDKNIGEFTALVNKCFGGFIYGQLVDAMIVGVLTFIMLSIFEISPYNLLISAVVAITNVIPVFGPFLGAIPSFFIVLISADPANAILFLILILIIQQVDGNILCPKILGDNTGISSLCVIIAITIAGSLWGILGMVIGVPLFAVGVEIVKRTIERELKKKNRSTDTVDYYPKNALGNAEMEVYYEHSSLKYRYEHSPWKARVHKIRKIFYKTTETPHTLHPEEKDEAKKEDSENVDNDSVDVNESISEDTVDSSLDTQKDTEEDTDGEKQE